VDFMSGCKEYGLSLSVLLNLSLLLLQLLPFESHIPFV
jgi:hypothetical protein